MALPFEIQIGRVSRFLSKFASTKGSSPRVSLGSEILPVLPFWSGVENRFLDSWNLYAASISAAIAAANLSGVRIRNPANSNIVAVIESLVATNGSAADQPGVTHGPSGVDLTTVLVATNTRLDARVAGVGGSGAGVLIVSSGNSLGGSPLSAAYSVKAYLTGGQVEFITTDYQEIPLLPGDALQVTSAVVNQGIQVSFRWRERALEESERT